MSSSFAGGQQPSRRVRRLLDEAQQEAAHLATGSGPTAGGAPADPHGVVEFRDVSTAVDGVGALKHVSFTARPGALTAVVGASGLAKAALVELMLSRRLPDSGEVFLGRESIRHARVSRESGRPQSALRVGVVPRDGGLLSSRTVQDNVAILLSNGSGLPLEQINDMVAVELDRLDLMHLAQCLPTDLAMGQRKRVALARALVGDPDLVVIDEPEAGLGPERAPLFMELIKHLQGESTQAYVVITQDLPLACTIADELVLMSRDTVVAAGSVDELRRSANRYARALLEEATGHLGPGR